MIPVTKTYLPPLDEYYKYLEKIWESGWVTNNGSLVTELEYKLKEYFGVKHVILTSNGTIAIQIALKAYDIVGEVITTPFSYVATTTSLIWENCSPVFVDIEKDSCCINPALIEEKITPRTKAILATHVYGIPCQVEEIEKVARKYNLRVIYDAAHAFGTIYKNRHLPSYGDISTLSFHATKLFHTVEGGAIITNDDEMARKIKLFRSFGHEGNDYFSVGINGKNSEIHAAMGLCVFPKVTELIERRKELCNLYDSILNTKHIKRPVIPYGVLYNYAYYPVIFQNEEVLLKVISNLGNSNIIPRRYFYPSLNKLPYIGEQNSCPVSEDITCRVLCLPLYHDLPDTDVRNIVKIINNVF